ncbi:hypothetical protein VD0004_g1092 [Verticillium dahliae]|nr:hypothetical protein VD0004_g1092 [Verticillium dahliae]PNH76784.1 hypothetical protein VD0001_g815 [Verticillium dahliae]
MLPPLLMAALPFLGLLGFYGPGKDAVKLLGKSATASNPQPKKYQPNKYQPNKYQPNVYQPIVFQPKVQVGISISQPEKDGKFTIKSNASSELGNVILFNTNGDFIGDYDFKGDSGTIVRGKNDGISEGTVALAQPRAYKDQQAMYTVFNGGEVPVCVAWATLTTPGGDGYLWTGDTGELCGEDWYFSGLRDAGFTGIDGYEPKCIWISSSYAKQYPNSGFQIHWPSYKPQKRPGATGDGKESYIMPSFQKILHRTCDPDSAVFRMHKYPDIYTSNIVGYRHHIKLLRNAGEKIEQDAEKSETPQHAVNFTRADYEKMIAKFAEKAHHKAGDRTPMEKPWTECEVVTIRQENHRRAEALARGEEYKYKDVSRAGCPQSRRVENLFNRPWGKEGYLDVGEGRARHSKRQQDGGNEAAALSGPSTASDPASASQDLPGPENPFNWLVVDSFVGNSAAYLCSSKSSRGPDFANAKEEMFCHMSDKTLHPFCAANDKKTADGGPCFDLESQQLVRGGIVKRHSPYVAVMDWRFREGRDGAKVNLSR